MQICFYIQVGNRAGPPADPEGGSPDGHCGKQGNYNAEESTIVIPYKKKTNSGQCNLKIVDKYCGCSLHFSILLTKALLLKINGLSNIFDKGEL